MQKQWIEIDREDFNFSAAQVLSTGGSLEELSGHNYQILVSLGGQPNDDGLIQDFRSVKEAIRRIISDLNHKTLIPLKHPKIDVTKDEDSVRIVSSGEVIVLPHRHCLLLELNNTTCESLARYILDRLWDDLRVDQMEEGALSVGVGESPGQRAWTQRTAGD